MPNLAVALIVVSVFLAILILYVASSYREESAVSLTLEVGAEYQHVPVVYMGVAIVDERYTNAVRRFKGLLDARNVPAPETITVYGEVKGEDLYSSIRGGGISVTYINGDQVGPVIEEVVKP